MTGGTATQPDLHVPEGHRPVPLLLSVRRLPQPPCLMPSSSTPQLNPYREVIAAEHQGRQQLEIAEACRQ